MFKYYLLILFTFFEINSTLAKEDFSNVVIEGSHTRHLQSQIVNQEYTLFIKLPAGYQQSNKSYPVIYSLDAQWDFPLLVSTYGQSYYDGFIPEAILVGVRWGGDNPDPNILRVRDFTPSQLSNRPGSGGAANFLGFIKKELIPFIDSQYRTQSKRVLMGTSLGGLFTLYTLFNEPSLFSGYIPVASASGWDNDALYAYAKTFKNVELTQPTRLYSTIGEYDGFLAGFKDLTAFFEKQRFHNLSVKFEVLANLGHASVKSAGNTAGLHYVFAKPQVSLSHEQLINWVGNYQSPAGIENYAVSLREKGLVINMPNGQINALLASDHKTFYKLGEYFNLEFDSAKKTIELEIETFADRKTLIKVQHRP